MSTTTRLAQHWLARGQVALHEGRRMEAIAAMRQAVASDPQYVEALLWLAGLCEDPDDSLRYLSRALALEPHNSMAHDGIRWARKRLHDQRIALESSVPHFLDQSTPQASSTTNSLTRVAAPAIAMVAPAAIAGVESHTPSASRPVEPPARPKKAARANGGVRIRKKLALSAIALWAAFLLLVSGGIVWLALHPAFDLRPTVVAARSAADQPLVNATLPTASQPAPVAEAAVDASRLYADHLNQTLAELDVAWAKEDWNQAIPLVAQAMTFRPGDVELKRKLMSAYYNQAVNLIDGGDLEEALAAYDQALDVLPGEAQVVSERETLANYLSALGQFSQRNWLPAIQSLTKVYAADAGYLDARGMLYRSYYNQGIDLKAKKDLAGAQKAFEAAVNLDNIAIEARGELAQVKAALAPPPAPAPSAPPSTASALGSKWIDINLTTQRFRALRGNTVLYSFVTSTGEPGRATQPGIYKVLDKIPNAYSRFWKLWMPYWMGIYWAGSSENGIHALPILSNGSILWAGLLGRRVSFGCVILDTAAAKLMFNWADIGSQVVIHR